MINPAASFFLLCLTIDSLPAQSFEPSIHAVVNAASMYQPPRDIREPGLGVAGGSIISIFGVNLARSTVVAEGFPLPTKLEETSVIIGGGLAPLFFVSPGQINAQVPSSLTLLSQRKGDYYTVPIRVRVGALERGNYPLRITQVGTGIFTADGSGCGTRADFPDRA